MATSLLYALLGVNDSQNLNVLAAQHPHDPNYELAIKYRDQLSRKQRREVRAALYRALEGIMRSPDVNPTLSMAIGKALCNAISNNPLGNIGRNPEIQSLYQVLQPIVRDAIDAESVGGVAPGQPGSRYLDASYP